MSHLVRENQRLNPLICRLEFTAPEIAEKTLPGQFIIVRRSETAERIPLTVYRSHPEKGTIEVIVQEAGASTRQICALKKGDQIRDVIGPLGMAAHIEKFGKAICVGGGVGVAEIYPVAAALKKSGNEVISIIGARSAELLILEPEMRAVSDKLSVMTDDGSAGSKGFVTDALLRMLEKEKFDIVFAVGPVGMMKRTAEVTRPYKLKTIVSLNSIMVDGTGMCGSCRVSVGNEVKFVCVDGPDFDAHQVDFTELEQRQKRFIPEESRAKEKKVTEHKRCHAL